jgi:hypothetical protein
MSHSVKTGVDEGSQTGIFINGKPVAIIGEP